MKNIIAALVVLGSVQAFAQAESAPCKQIKAACGSAGFVKGNHKKDGKGLYKDCMQPILAGKSVVGVTVAQDVVAACNVKKADKKK
jgi:hypothetical protein